MTTNKPVYPTRTLTTALLVVVVTTIAFATGVWLSIQQAANTDGMAVDGLLWPDPPAVAPFHLLDQRERPFTREQLLGRWTMVFFGFTHCPDICPTSLESMARAAEQLADNPAWAERGQVVFISVDPERDQPDILAPYVAHFSPDFLGVTGSQEELKTLARSMGVLFIKVEQGASYTMDHSAGVFIISPAVELVSVLTPPHAVADIVHRFKTISDFIEKQS